MAVLLAVLAPCSGDITNGENKVLQTSVSQGQPSSRLGPTTANAEKAVMKDATRVKHDIDASLKALNKIKAGATAKLSVSDTAKLNRMKAAVSDAAMKKNAKSALISAPADSAVISSWSSKPPPTLPASPGPRGRAPAMPHQPAWFNDGPYAIMGKLPPFLQFLHDPPPASLLPSPLPGKVVLQCLPRLDVLPVAAPRPWDSRCRQPVNLGVGI